MSEEITVPSAAEACEHQWDGPTVELGGGVVSSTCSKCGTAAFDEYRWRWEPA